jgi:glycosyltransferase involved in cell wall biosynthesis
MLSSKLKIALDARLPDEGQGGVQQVLVSLADAFSTIDDQNFSRLWIVFEGTTWWQGVFPLQDEVLFVSAPFAGMSLKLTKRFPKLVSRLYPIVARFLPQRPLLDDILLTKEVDLVHIPYQDGLFTELPFIYNPHDLQHIHYPNFFRRSQIQHRNHFWRDSCKRANLVLSASPMVTRDLRDYWGISSDKIRLIPIPPPSRTVNSEVNITDFPSDFCIYPAVFWPHKNHINLIRAWSKLKALHHDIPLILTGAETQFTAELKKEISNLELSKQIIFAGHVSNAELTSLLSRAKVVVVPSLFEAMSLTVWDAQLLGTAVACSDIDPFPLQVGDTALLFNPIDPDDIAEKVLRLWTDPVLRSSLSSKASKRLTCLTSSNYGLAMLGTYLECIDREQTNDTSAARASLVSVLEISDAHNEDN